VLAGIVSGGVLNQFMVGSAAVLVQSEMQAFAAGSFIYLVGPISALPCSRRVACFASTLPDGRCLPAL
jgi:hypothetical protein